MRKVTSKGRKRVLDRIDIASLNELHYLYQNLAFQSRIWPGGREFFIAQITRWYSDRKDLDKILSAAHLLYDPKEGERTFVRMMTPLEYVPEDLTNIEERLYTHYRIAELQQGYPSWIREDDNIPNIARDSDTIAKIRKALERKRIIQSRRTQHGLLIHFR